MLNELLRTKLVDIRKFFWQTQHLRLIDTTGEKIGGFYIAYWAKIEYFFLY